MTFNDNAAFSFLYEGYKPADQATNSGDSDIYYYGFVNKVGEYYIMRHDTSAGADNLQEYRYVKGDGAYSTAWSARESLDYGAFNTIFN